MGHIHCITELLWKPKRRLDDNMKIKLNKYNRYVSMGQIQHTQDGIKWRFILQHVGTSAQLCSIKGVQFLHQSHNFQLLKKDYTLSSY